MNFQMFELDFEKAKEPEIKLPKSIQSSKKSREFQKISTSALLSVSKPLTGSQQTVENSSRDGNTRTPYLPPEKPVCNHVQLELDMEQQTSSKLGTKYIKAVYPHPSYLICMQSTSCKMPGWMRHKLESRFPGEISITSDTQLTPPLMAECADELKSLLMKMKEES